MFKSTIAAVCFSAVLATEDSIQSGSKKLQMFGYKNNFFGGEKIGAFGDFNIDFGAGYDVNYYQPSQSLFIVNPQVFVTVGGKNDIGFYANKLATYRTQFDV
jgi:hypothetical protein